MHTIYSPKDVKIVWNGYPITGFAEDSFIRLEWADDIVNEKVGADGELALTKIASTLASVEIELMDTAMSNRVLAQIEKEQRASDGLTVSDMTFKDKSNNILVSKAVNAYMKTRPSVDLGSEQGSKVWVFGCERLEFPTEDTDEADFSIITSISFDL